jgi:hypothetical protein
VITLSVARLFVRFSTRVRRLAASVVTSVPAALSPALTWSTAARAAPLAYSFW